MRQSAKAGTAMGMRTTANTSKRCPKTMRAIALLLALACASSICLSACVSNGPGTAASSSQTASVDQPNSTEQEPVLRDVGIIENTDYDSFYLDIAIDDFNALGFAYGDSVDIVLSNGFTAENIPYYSGYFAPYGDLQLCAYQGMSYIIFCSNCGHLWSVSNVTSDDTATVTLHERGTYRTLQDTMGKSSSSAREDYASDAAFANFRALKGGSLKLNLFYRSASPYNNYYNRAPYVDALMREAGINFVLDLADSAEKTDGYIAKDDFNSPYFLELYNSGRVASLNLYPNFKEDAYRASLIAGLRQLMQNDGPYLINCLEGRDRTGFVSALIESLAGASYDEIKTDYMISYANNYGITEESSPESYQAVCDVRLSEILCSIAALEDGSDLENVDYQAAAKRYLLDGGMSEAEVDQLIDLICS